MKTTESQRKWRARWKARDPEGYRRQRREEQNRLRAKRYAAGLRADGRPIVNLALSRACRKLEAAHPADCLCYDCLWKPVAYERPTCRVQARD